VGDDRAGHQQLRAQCLDGSRALQAGEVGAFSSGAGNEPDAEGELAFVVVRLMNRGASSSASVFRPVRLRWSKERPRPISQALKMTFMTTLSAPV